ncbi:hypothetical protein [Nitrospirillum sp. BR 11828]|uniref:hypothetical protein n=1 Tax=Nitrospirillum sp. BR 11828 TaxID=3104325 RepID=UPI002ACAF103|nr:hypothetical protein [Nitrospirillum sp. BR 11828]MDZ5648663.1 hypothetical protein [Nitrospirillum sp. BR 11828]
MALAPADGGAIVGGMIRSSLPLLLAFLTLVAVVTGWSGTARAHDCVQHPQMATQRTMDDQTARPSPLTTRHTVAVAAHACHQAADCCCVGGMAGCAAACAGALVPPVLPDAARTATLSALTPAGDVGGAGLALAPALGPPRPTAFA